MTVTMEDVARRAGVAKSTVSLVLNGRPGTSEAVQQAVHEAAEALGYRLRSRVGKTHAVRPLTVALVHCVSQQPDIDEGTTRFFLAYEQGVRQAIGRRSINLTLVSNHQETDAGQLSIRLLTDRSRPFDGLILMGAGLHVDSHIVRYALDHALPLVVLGRNWQAHGISSVSQDHRQQALLALDYLRQLGHEQIGFVARNSDRQYIWFRQRMRAFEERMQAWYGQTDDDLVAVGADALSATQQLLQRRPQTTAILALNDYVAYQVITAATAAGRHIPHDLSVIGIDGILPADGRQPLTTVCFNHVATGRVAAQLLLQLIDDSEVERAHFIMRSRIAIGESSQAV